MPSIGVVVESAFDELFLMTEVNDNKTIEMIRVDPVGLNNKINNFLLIQKTTATLSKTALSVCKFEL